MLVGVRTTVAVVSAVVLLAGGAVRGSQQEPRFEVASVREVAGTRADGVPYSLSLKVVPGRIDITNASLNQLIVLAFDVPYDRVGWPEELKRRRDEKLFDVRATLPEGATRAHLPAMLRALLIDRFG